MESLWKEFLSEGFCFLFCVALFTFIFINRKSFVKFISNFYHGDKIQHNSSALCDSPGCVRCNKYEQAQIRAKKRLDMYLAIVQAEPEGPKTNHKHLDRISESVMAEGNVEYEVENQCPNVLYVKGLLAKPIWQDCMFQADVKILESNADSIFKEFECVYASTFGWVCNTTPTGKWLVFHLVNQGTKLEDNCKKCPHTVSLLKALPSFMGCNLLGNASFSVVYPGTEIAEHFGPTNIRIRTHLGLVVPPECELHVGGQTATWKQGQCTVFDDSFSHSVKHSVKGEGSRVVFMVDLWHPGLTLEEKIALDFIYSPDL